MTALDSKLGKVHTFEFTYAEMLRINAAWSVMCRTAPRDLFPEEIATEKKLRRYLDDCIKETV